jgi:prepilin-type N-terminal cleavage/methylation domain-containing protein
MPSDSRKYSLGFTLIELLTVLAIISILTLTSYQYAIEGFKRLRAKSMLTSSTRSFIHAAHVARYQAQARQEFITLSPICGNRWDQGWIVFIHPLLKFDQSHRVDDVLLKHVPPLDLTSNQTSSKDGHAYSGNGFADISVNNHQLACAENVAQHYQSTTDKFKHISFNPAGGAQMKNGGLIANRLIFSSREYPDIQQQVIMGAGGRLRICTPTLANSYCRQ